jgi:hypothetical protein
MRKVLALVALCVASAALGCGGSGSSGTDAARSYVTALNRAQGRFATTVTRLSHRVTPKSSAATDRTTLHAFDGAVTRVVRDLRSIAPPARVARLHGRLVADLGAFGAQLHSATRALSSHDRGRVIAAQRRLRTATARVARQLTTTIRAINQRLRA